MVGPLDKTQFGLTCPPTQVVFVHIENPYELDTPEEGPPAEHEAQFLNDVETSATDAAQPGDVMPAVSTAADAAGIAMATSKPEPYVDVAVLELQLMRHYKEGPGQWMDTFDTSAFFSSKVPVLAATKPLLKFAVCAFAAKHMSLLGTPSRSPSPWHGRVWPSINEPGIDWHCQAIKYYNLTIGLLKSATDVVQLDLDPSNHTSPTSIMFAAVAILSVFESMDASGSSWRAHLDALPILNSTCGSTGFSPVALPQAVVTGPIFWNLVRGDFLCSFLSETQTRLKLDDIGLWQNAGFAADVNGAPLPFSPSGNTHHRSSTDVPEDTRSNELLWLLGKLVNFLTSGDALVPEDFSLPPEQRFPLGITQDQLLERWGIMDAEFSKWNESLPSTFTPSARVPLTADRGPTGFQQIWYDLPICAATMQSYHMGCILLSTNKPQQSTAIRSTLSARFRYYRQVQERVTWHAREICGISLANPPGPVRIHSVLPLFVAGQVFSKHQDQHVVTELLSSIESDLGWVTRYHRDRLLLEWGEESTD
ncbi:hypothetical protein S7711_10034 [Stachybotrys chartarum IBT 7711]|uniref:Transcription factor domain-containing protein n=1 Tax=Stachybotrys chartarum (strain CBS 109288 / IBT 7711) TaxID=1280523 RepID=A0A084B269_STACB|nr:hypothetical protein S7711_10034 [Stachybotrys chartarum IBT 7711]